MATMRDVQETKAAAVSAELEVKSKIQITVLNELIKILFDSGMSDYVVNQKKQHIETMAKNFSEEVYGFLSSFDYME